MGVGYEHQVADVNRTPVQVAQGDEPAAAGAVDARDALHGVATRRRHAR